MEAEVALDADTDDGEDRPDHEACRQSDRAHDERRFARSRVQRLCYRHGHCPSRFDRLLPAPKMRSPAHPRRPSMKAEHKAGLDSNTIRNGIRTFCPLQEKDVAQLY